MVAQLILESILKFGLLCTPERLHVYPDQETADERKRMLLWKGAPEYSHTQSRFCATLCTAEELFQAKIRGVVPGPEGPVVGGDNWLSHADLFGPYAVSFDPVISRRLGIVPTVYYSPSDIFGNRYSAAAERDAPGLNIQMIHRLKELRELLILLAIIERSITVDDFPLPGDEILKALGLTLPFEDDVVQRIYDLTLEQREKIFQLFNIDREMALNLISFTEMMLSLYQETDSTIDGRILAFYEQREWRLIHHMRVGMIWYSLGDQPEFRNPLARMRQSEIQQMRNSLVMLGGKVRTDEYFRHCWVLEEVDGVPIRNYVSRIVVPHHVFRPIKKLVRNLGYHADVAAAEDYGYVPAKAAR